MAFKWALTVTCKWVQTNHYLSKVIWEKLVRHNCPLKQQQQQHQHHHQHQQQQQSVITIAQVLVFLFWFSARHLWAGTNKSKKSFVQISDSWDKRWRNISDTFFSISDNFLGSPILTEALLDRWIFFDCLFDSLTQFFDRILVHHISCRLEIRQPIQPLTGYTY